MFNFKTGVYSEVSSLWATVEEWRTEGPRGAAVDEDMAVATADAAGVFVVIAFAAAFIEATVLVARRLIDEDSMVI